MLPRAMFYRAFRAWARFVLRLFYRVQLAAPDPAPEGAVIYVGNHPNGLVDPGLLFAFTQRQLTVLAKAPLFRIPILAQVLRGIGALPVYRAHEDPTKVVKNRDTMDQSTQILVDGRAVMLFPEGRSHSDPSLGELKSGAARMALAAAEKGVTVRIIPVGLIYSDKHRFRSEAHVTFGTPLVVAPGTTEPPRALTDRIAAALGELTVNLREWDELPLLQTAEALYALRSGSTAADPERLRAFSRGVAILREERPEELEGLRGRLASFRRRLELTHATPEHLAVSYSPARVVRFAVRNVAALVTGLPLFLLGMVVFFIPYWIPWSVARVSKVEWDTEGTIKLVTAIFVAPFWGAVIFFVSRHYLGTAWAVLAVIAALPLALFTRYFLERRAEAWQDTQVFFALVRRRRLKALLKAEADELATRIEALVASVRERAASIGSTT